MFEKIHKEILGMFDDYAIFGDGMRPIKPAIKAHQWIAVTQHIESLIVNENYPKDFAESSLRRGLIQVYLYYFASRYLNRPEYTYKYIQGRFLSLRNLNQLQRDREMVFSELLLRMKAANKADNFTENADTMISREALMHSLCDRLEGHPFLLLIGPQGMGKSVTLELISDFMRGNWQVYNYHFSISDQISHPDYFANQMLNYFKLPLSTSNRSGARLFLLDDIHLLPPVLQQVLRRRVLPEFLSLEHETQSKIAIIAASAFPLKSLITYQRENPRFVPYQLVEFNEEEVAALWNKSPQKSSYSPEEIFKVTRGYPSLVGQMVTSGITFDNSLWFNAIFKSVNWDESLTALMKALCTFRYIGPFFMSDLAKFINDPYRLWEIWRIPETILDTAQAHSLWEKLVHRNAFVQRVSNEHKEFPLDKNFVILRILRQLAENAVHSEQPAIYDQRHKLASEYYYSQIKDPLIPGNKKALLTIEYFYHLAKRGLSSKQIFSISHSLVELARSAEGPVDIHNYTDHFLKYFSDDSELKDVMGEVFFNEIIAATKKELGK